MARTDIFRKQHQELAELVRQFKSHLDVNGVKTDGAPARSLLVQLAGKLKVHLAMEDKSLYPQLLEHRNAEVKAKAKKFMDGMGGILQTFNAYVLRYPTGTAIQATASQFVKETNDIFDVLAKRIQAEDTDLYVTVDRLE